MLTRRHFVVAGTAAGFVGGRARASDRPVVACATGRLGGVERDGVRIFRGVPYAASTGGAARFLPPRAAEPWAGVRDALTPAYAAPQLPASPNRIFEWYTRIGATDEDCLGLDLYAPASLGLALRPVMVWLHGGGWVQGCGSAPGFEATYLARLGDVVVVAPNHRLNLFGYLPLDDPDPRYADSANVGVLDMVAALRWVRDNIERFGGDPANVTIFGQSGGAAKVSALLAAPCARGLFHRAIAQSCSGSLRLAEPSEAGADAARMAAALGVRRLTAAALADISAERLLAAWRRTGGVFRPVRDGRTFDRHPFDPDAPPSAADVPLMIGNTADETRLTLAANPANFSLDAATVAARVERFLGVPAAKAKAILGHYAALDPTASPSDLLADVTTDYMYIRNTRREATLQAARAGAPVYAYLFRWRTPVLDGRLGSPHAVEVPFVFGSLAAASAYVGRGSDLRRLSAIMIRTWATFARTGAPAAPALPIWPRFKPTSRNVMCLANDAVVARDPLAARRAILDDLPAYDYAMPITYARS